jgi:hypothetical protein
MKKIFKYSLFLNITLVVVVCILLFKGHLLALESVTLLSPQEGQVVYAGETLKIILQPSLGTSVKSVLILSPLEIIEIKDPPAEIPFKISKDRDPGPVTITVVAITGLGGGKVTRTIQVEAPSVLEQIIPDPMILNLDTFYSKEQEVIVKGIYRDGITRYIEESSYTVFSSDNPRVATVDTQGVVKMVAPGITTVRISNNGLTTSVKVQVNINERKGDYDGDHYVDQNDLNAILAWLNDSATGPDDPRDLNHDGQIDNLDVQLLKSLCVNAGCVTWEE